MIVDFLTQNLGDLRHVLRQGNYHMQMLVAQAKSAADGLELIRASRVLTAGHTRCQVVANDHGDVGILVDGIEQTRHTAMSERGVADDGQRRPLSGISSTLCHRDTCTHVDTRMNGLVRRQEAQRVATDVAKDARILILQKHLVESRINVAMAAALAECRWTWSNILAGSEILAFLHAEGFLHHIGIELARARQLTREATHDVRHFSHATHDVLYERLTFLDDEHTLTFSQHATNQLLGKRILRNLQQRIRTTRGEAL